MAARLPVLPVEAQPLGAAVLRVAAALDYLGQPLSDAETAAIENAAAPADFAASGQGYDPALGGAPSADWSQGGAAGGDWGAAGDASGAADWGAAPAPAVGADWGASAATPH